MIAQSYSFWALGSREPGPLVVIAKSSDGPWVHQLAPMNLPELPIQFLKVREGVFGPVLSPASLVLFRRDLVAVLHALSIDSFDIYPAIIRHPRSTEGVDDYFVVKVRNKIPLKSVSVSPRQPTLAVLSEATEVVVVSEELRASLEASGIPDLMFFEPILVG